MSKKRKRKIGLPPGTIVFTGEKKTENVDIVLVEYNADDVSEKFFVNQVPEIQPCSKPDTVKWYDLRGLDNINILEEFGHVFQIHPLALEDIASIGQRPKFEEYESGFFIVLQVFHFKPLELTFQTEQISFYVGKNFLISFQEDSDDIFLSVRNHIKAGKDKIRQKGSEFLAYALVDYVVDYYLDNLDLVEEKIENMEKEVVSHPTTRLKSDLYRLKSELNAYKKNIFLLREAISRWIRVDSDFYNQNGNVFLRDLLDHCNMTLERAESYREMITELQTLYVTELSARAGGVINMLTLISSIFIPLTFIVGVYGMNFENMPELRDPNGYFYTLSGMGLLAISLIIYFKYRKWI